VTDILVHGGVRAKFPRIRLGIVRGSIDARVPDISGRIAEMRVQAMAQLARNGVNAETLETHPHVVGWRQTYEACGVKPKKFRPTHEALARRLLRDGAWPEINPIVDIYLTNQVAHLLPHGGYDLAQISGPIRLRESSGGEAFTPLGGGAEITEPGEVVYDDTVRVLTRRWNWRDADATKITAETRTFLLMLEAADPMITDAAVEMATTDLVNRYRATHSGQFEGRFVVADDQPIPLLLPGTVRFPPISAWRQH
jgi:DNA/RNA-binding domain of Phe-tRNA-synthetase-like protein